MDDLGVGTGPPGEPRGGRIPGIGGGYNRINSQISTGADVIKNLNRMLKMIMY